MAVTLVDLDGITTARLTATKVETTLILCAPSGFIEGKYYPAESITLQDGAVKELYELLRASFEAPKPPPAPPLPVGALTQPGGFRL